MPLNDPPANRQTDTGAFIFPAIVQTLKDFSAYVTVLNYLEAALQLLKQAELADRSALMARLQNLSEFDQNTVQLITKRYQASARSQASERAPTDQRAVRVQML